MPGALQLKLLFALQGAWGQMNVYAGGWVLKGNDTGLCGGSVFTHFYTATVITTLMHCLLADLELLPAENFRSVPEPHQCASAAAGAIREWRL